MFLSITASSSCRSASYSVSEVKGPCALSTLSSSLRSHSRMMNILDIDGEGGVGPPVAACVQIAGPPGPVSPENSPDLAAGGENV